MPTLYIANRYDLLCMEGLVRALQIFQGINKELPKYSTILPSNKSDIITMRVTQTTKQIRQYVVGAILRNIEFTEESYNSFIKLQEKLHFNICRRRALVAIGTHDLDTLKPPFLYDARAPKDIKFRALKEEKEMDAVELFKEYNERVECVFILHYTITNYYIVNQNNMTRKKEFYFFALSLHQILGIAFWCFVLLF